MKTKEIIVGNEYYLRGYKHSAPGGSIEYFKILSGEKVHVLKKLNNFNNKNTIQVQGIVLEPEGYVSVSFWCSPYDLSVIA